MGELGGTMKHFRIVSLPVLCVFAGTLGCTAATGSWEWQPSTEQALVVGKDKTIWECEMQAAEERDDNRFRELLNARPYGGWGDFGFEFCMAQNGWRLTYMP